MNAWLLLLTALGVGTASGIVSALIGEEAIRASERARIAGKC